MNEYLSYLKLLQFLLSGREMGHVFHELIEVLFRMAVGAVKVPRAGDGYDDKRHQNNVFDVVGPVFRRTEEHNVHGFDGDLLPVDWIFDPQHGRQILSIVYRQPVFHNKTCNEGYFSFFVFFFFFFFFKEGGLGVG